MSERPGLNQENTLHAFEAWSGWSVIGESRQERIKLLLQNLLPKKILLEIREDHTQKETNGVPAIVRPFAEVIQVEEVLAVILRALQLQKALETKSEELLEELLYRLCAEALGRETCTFIPRDELMHEVIIPASFSMVLDAADEGE